MKLLCIDNDSNALDVLMRAQQYGHEVMWFDQKRKNGEERRAGEGIVPKLRDFEKLRSRYFGWADLIYFPQNACYVDLIEPYRQMGYPVYGANVEAARWEIDRAEGQRIMKECGLPIIEGREFRDYDSAIAYVRSNGKPFVSKPSGEADKALSYVANSAADLCYMLGKWSKNDKYRKDAKEHGFILQEKKIGCEMGVSGWFGLHGWSKPIEETFEYKKLMTGDIGVNTGEQGTLLRFVEQSKLADLVLFPLTKNLREIGYIGNINVNCIIDDDGTPWPLEFTMREGWPAKHNQIALQEGDPAQWMLDLVNGRDTMKVRYGECSVSVVVTIPDYPFSTYTGKEVEGIPVYGVSDPERIHLCEVMLGDCVPVQAGDKVVEMPCYVTAGDYVLVVTGTGETITGARRSAYAALDKIKIPNSPGWRTDIGRGKLVDNLANIQKHGFSKELSY